MVIMYDSEQLIAMPKLDNYSESEQLQAVWNSIIEWNVKDKLRIHCCYTTALNIGRIKRSYVLFEHKLDREMINFACRHIAYEFVLKVVPEVTNQKKLHE